MPDLIPRPFIDNVLLRTDIVDIIGDRIRLRKTGKNYSALCPFHQEKTPSFSVSPDKQFYHCFGCGKSGNAIGFLMDYEQFTFIEAIETLAKRAGLSLPRQALNNNKQRAQQQRNDAPLYDVLANVATFYQSQLQQHPKAKEVRRYLQKRGLENDVINHFQLGYAPPGWENVLQYAKRQGYSTTQLSQAGLIIEKNQHKRYDRFRDRVMFPIRDHRGRTIAFGGRVLDDSTPKYLNSPETTVFQKSTELYGLFEARRAYNNLHSVILVEGYMDVIGLYQHGLRCGVATLGTSVSTSHFQRLFRYTDRVVCCFDGDNAGRLAAWRALEASLSCLNDKNSICFLLLPEGEDPDSLIAKEGKAAFVSRLQQAMSFSDFLLSQLLSKHDVTSIDGRARFIQALSPLLAKLNNVVLRSMLIERIAELCRTSHSQVEALLTTQKTAADETSRIKPKANQQGRLTPMRLAICLLLQYPSCATLVAKTELTLLTQLDIPGMSILTTLLTLLHDKPKLTTAALLEYWRDKTETASLHQLASWPLTLPENAIADEFNGAIKRIKALTLEKQIEHLFAKAKQTTLSEQERTQLQTLLQQQAQRKHDVDA